MAQTGMSLGRAVGPALGGTIWSWGLARGLDSHALVRSFIQLQFGFRI